MRRFLFLAALVLGLALPAAAWPSSLAPGDGTLVVDNGSGVVTVHARGGVIGRFDSGRVTVQDFDLGNGHVPVVYGADSIKDLGGGRTQYTGENVRFRIIGGQFLVRIVAVGIDVSAVGRGTVSLDATGFADFPGHYSLDGGPFLPLPGHLATFTLGLALNVPLGK